MKKTFLLISLILLTLACSLLIPGKPGLPPFEPTPSLLPQMTVHAFLKVTDA